MRESKLDEIELSCSFQKINAIRQKIYQPQINQTHFCFTSLNDLYVLEMEIQNDPYTFITVLFII